jgi:hypothetical protein
MTDNGHCHECGAVFRKREFSTDWLGRVILDHQCDSVRRARYQQIIPKAPAKRSAQMRANFGAVITCIDCGVTFDGWKVQKRCTECARKQSSRVALARYHRNKGRAA